MVLDLETIETVLIRQVALMEAVQTALRMWGVECPFSDEGIVQVREVRDQVVAMVSDGITELEAPEKP